MAELGLVMGTDSDRSSENRYQELGSAEEPQRAGTSGWVGPDRVVPPWSVPPRALAPQAGAQDAERPDAVPAEPGPANDDDDFPGVAPAAGWFLRSAPVGSADSTHTADAEEDLTGEWFAAPAPEPGESPISWREDPEPPVPAAARRPLLAAEPVVSPTRALRGRPGGPGLPPRRPVAGSRRTPADQSPW